MESPGLSPLGLGKYFFEGGWGPRLWGECLKRAGARGGGGGEEKEVGLVVSIPIARLWEYLGTRIKPAFLWEMSKHPQFYFQRKGGL